MCTSMDTAARAIDAMLHRGYAEERDGGVWVDDLGARELAEDYIGVQRERELRWEAEEDARLVQSQYDEMREDRDEAMRLIRRVLDTLDELPDDADGEELNEVIGMVLTILEPARARA